MASHGLLTPFVPGVVAACGVARPLVPRCPRRLQSQKAFRSSFEAADSEFSLLWYFWRPAARASDGPLQHSACVRQGTFAHASMQASKEGIGRGRIQHRRQSNNTGQESTLSLAIPTTQTHTGQTPCRCFQEVKVVSIESSTPGPGKQRGQRRADKGYVRGHSAAPEHTFVVTLFDSSICIDSTWMTPFSGILVSLSTLFTHHSRLSTSYRH